LKLFSNVGRFGEHTRQYYGIFEVLLAIKL
jgi:hypothetical protein